MRIAILADIHANREATEAALATVRDLAPDQIVLLGDLVGYGPDPVYAVETAARLVADGALCIQGNHDEAAAGDGPVKMTPNARAAMIWTRAQLAPAHRSFLTGLPLTAELGDTSFVHASAFNPPAWNYVDDARAARLCLDASSAALILCGHTHRPAIHYALPGRMPVPFKPLDNVPAPLSALRRHVVVAGSVGQPRDRNPAACLALLDTGAGTVTMVRVPYDAGGTARKIAAAHLPPWLGMRLLVGR